MLVGMQPYFQRVGNIAFEEMRQAEFQNHEVLPDGIYGFMEFYCADPQCDCRRVLIRVVRPDGVKVWASINYGWESADFYQRWTEVPPQVARNMAGAMLDPLGPQTKCSQALFDLFTQRLLKDEAYVARLKRHYDTFKATLTPKSRPKPPLAKSARSARSGNRRA